MKRIAILIFCILIFASTAMSEELIVSNYGDAGVLILPWQNFSVSLYQYRKGHSQEIIDRENSAIYGEYNSCNRHCIIIGDHAKQGFRVIGECKYTYPAIIQTPTSTRIYRWLGTLQGRRSGYNEFLCTGQSLLDVKWADICLSTCSEANGNGLIMTFFKLQEEVNYEMYKVQNKEKSDFPSYTNNLYIKATANVNIRKGPSTSYEIIGILNKDSKVPYLEIVDPTNKWFLVEYNGIKGWVNSKYSTIE